MFGLSRKSVIGVVLIAVGCLLFVPAIGPETDWSANLALAVGTLVLTAGTYLFGTDVSGYPA
jgi:hypothetical protein